MPQNSKKDKKESYQETLIKLFTTLITGIDELLADSLPTVTNIHLDKDIAKLLSNYTLQEKKFWKI